MSCEAEPRATCTEHVFCLMKKAVREAAEEAQGLVQQHAQLQRAALEHAALHQDLPAIRTILRDLKERLRQLQRDPHLQVEVETQRDGV